MGITKKSADWIWPVLTVLIFATAIVRMSLSSLNHDSAWLLYAAQKLTGGATLYVDVVEVNPPLIIWLGLPSLWISDLTGLTMGGGHRAWVFTLAALSLWICSRLLKRLDISGSGWILAALTFACTWMVSEQFSQREHFLVIFVLPYVILAALRARRESVPVWAAAAIGVFAALGICIKPYYILLPAAIEFYLLAVIGLRAVLKRPEPYAMVAFGLSYLASIFILTPEYIELSFGYGSDLYNRGFKTGPWRVVSGMHALLVCAFFGLLAKLVLVLKLKGGNALYTVFGLASLALLAGYLIQFKGWDNHVYPALVFALVPAIAAAAALWRKGGGGRVFAALLGPAVLWMAVSLPVTTQWVRDDTARVAQYLKSEYKAESILIMSATIYDGFPMVTEHNLTWASRFSALWLVPGLQTPRDDLSEAQQARLQKAEDYSRKSVAEDIVIFKPDVILVDSRQTKKMFSAPYDYIEDFSKDPDFASEFSNYEQRDWHGAYALYVRKPRA